MERFRKLINGFKPLTVFAKGAVGDFWRVTECDSGLTNNFLFYILACLLKSVCKDFSLRPCVV